jgi:hypothetical protein
VTAILFNLPARKRLYSVVLTYCRDSLHDNWETYNTEQMAPSGEAAVAMAVTDLAAHPLPELARIVRIQTWVLHPEQPKDSGPL